MSACYYGCSDRPCRHTARPLEDEPTPTQEPPADPSDSVAPTARPTALDRDGGQALAVACETIRAGSWVVIDARTGLLRSFRA